MSLEPFAEVLHAGLGLTIQDRGRMGWRAHGVPESGVMDDHAAGWANHLLNNPPDAPVLELLLQGARLRIREEGWIVVSGADAGANVHRWRPVRVDPGQVLEFPANQSGVWIYLAVDGGWKASRYLGSASCHPRGGMGRPVMAGDALFRNDPTHYHLPAGVAGQTLDPSERRDYRHAPPLRVWPGPQWEQFTPDARRQLFEARWTISSQSDRVGYRLTGGALPVPHGDMVSEPVLTGSIQVPPDGQPIVTMRDGPTVGGYPKIGLVDHRDLSWLTQCRPGTEVRFVAVP